MVAVAKTPLPHITRVHAPLAWRIEAINRFFQRALSKRRDDRPGDTRLATPAFPMALLFALIVVALLVAGVVGFVIGRG